MLQSEIPSAKDAGTIRSWVSRNHIHRDDVSARRIVLLQHMHPDVPGDVHELDKHEHQVTMQICFPARAYRARKVSAVLTQCHRRDAGEITGLALMVISQPLRMRTVAMYVRAFCKSPEQRWSLIRSTHLPGLGCCIILYAHATAQIAECYVPQIYGTRIQFVENCQSPGHSSLVRPSS